MRAIALALSALLLSGTAAAFAPDLSDLANVKQMTVSATVVKSAVASAKNQPLQFAVGATLGATTDSGSWDEPEAGVARWRLRVHSDGASSLNLAFSNLQLPAGAALYLYSSGGEDVQGPYTAADNGRLWSPLVRSDTIVVEARMPSGERDAFAAQISQAFHGYRNIAGKSFTYDPVNDLGNGSSGACENDVACSIGNDWRDEIRSTVLLTVVSGNNEYFCTGTLVNNAAQDDRALILTANHCLIRKDNVSGGATTAYFNVERSGCNSGTRGSVSQHIAGKTLLAATRGTTVTDYTLFELASIPPSSYDVHYAGWEVSSEAPSSGAVVHHPAADDKKISSFTQAATAQNGICFTESDNDTDCSEGFRVDGWEVYWANGATEGGSSGSGLLNQSKRVVGTLSGGASGCAAIGTANNGQPDYFARLDKAWTAASTTGTTLKDALNPKSATACYSALDGRDAGTTAASGTAALCDRQSDGGGALGIGFAPIALAALWRRRKPLR